MVCEKKWKMPRALLKRYLGTALLLTDAVRTASQVDVDVVTSSVSCVGLFGPLKGAPTERSTHRHWT